MPRVRMEDLNPDVLELYRRLHARKDADAKHIERQAIS